MEQHSNNVEKVTSWVRNSITLKMITITILALLLLIPVSMVTSIIQEREKLNEKAVNEVSEKWAGKQQLNGPVLTIPITYESSTKDGVKEKLKHWHIMPKTLDINGQVSPEILKRGIYEVVVYQSKLALEGVFELDDEPDKTDLKSIHYDKAFLTIGISDMKGVKDDVAFSWNGQPVDVDPGSRIPELISAGITVKLPSLHPGAKGQLPFHFDLELHGSQDLSFIPLGNSTKVHLTSEWTSPSFNGTFLPDHRTLNQDGFEAEWKVLQLNRNFPGSWVGEGMAEKVKNTSFGVSLISPLGNYQKSMRSAKYAVMTIALTFLIFFLVEITNKRKIHPFQYALVGLSLCLFYVLLVSFSEHVNFNLAYGISTVIIVGMISLYSLTVFRKLKLSMVLLATLISVYSFMFVTLQLNDYALLIGSVGLTVLLAVTMYFTRNINWYRLNRDE